MSTIVKKVERIVKQLNPQQLEEVIDFAEFLEFKNKKKKSRPKTNQPARLKQLEISVIKEVEYLGDPLLRREDIYDANIVATMLTHGVTQLITFNPDDIKKFKEIKVIIP